jgi:uncharacterized membrane protein YccC
MAMLALACAVGSGLPAGPAIQYAGAVLAVGGMATVLATALSFADRRRCGGHAVARADWRAELRRLPRSPGPRMAARTGTAVLLAGGTAVITGLDHAYWGMAAAAAVLGQGTYAAAANRRALARGTGTLLGVLLAGPLLAAHPRGVAAALLLGALIFLSEVSVTRHYGLAVVFLAPISVLLMDVAGRPAEVGPQLLTLVLETVIGCVSAVVAGQLVSRRWVVRQLLIAAADLPASARPEPAQRRLEQARARLVLVGERTAAERRNVSASAHTLDTIVDQTLHLAEASLLHPAGAVGDMPRENAGEVLRLLARRLDSPPAAGPLPLRGIDDLPVATGRLAHAIDAWSAGPHPR